MNQQIKQLVHYGVAHHLLVPKPSEVIRAFRRKYAHCQKEKGAV